MVALSGCAMTLNPAARAVFASFGLENEIVFRSVFI